jgi:hypothetical protein
VHEERNRRGGGEEQKGRCEEAHGSRWRAAKARRSGTPNGASVVTIS